MKMLSPTAFTFAGQTFNVQAAPPAAMGQPQGQPLNPLISQLHQVLYTYTYQQRFEGMLRPPTATQSPGEDLTTLLSEANASRERWIAGWRIVQVTPSGQISVQKKGAVRSAWPGEFITHDGPGAPLRVGAMVTLFMPRESRTMQPGFYFAFGEVATESYELADAVRFYWNLQDVGAAELVRILTKSLNRFQIPFRFKCCSHRNLFNRLDSAVLYVNKRHYHVTAEVLTDVYLEVRKWLETDTPLFTRQLAPGLAFAEEPGTGESFGGFCCRIVAEGLWNASVQGLSTVRQQLDAIKDQFAKYGVNFDHPYLRPGSVDNYDFPAFERRHR